MEYFALSLNTALTFDTPPGKPISNAASFLRRDMEKTLEVSTAKKTQMRVAPPEPDIPAESWVIEVSAEEIVVRCGDSLGCVYALLYISEHFLGITPFWYWNDQHFTKRAFIHIPLGRVMSKPYAIRFRGWFVNDEVLIENWRSEPENREHWAMVFEALLRCGGNMTIPGTDANSRKYRELSAGMGLMITHHHAEPLGADMFSRIFPDETPSYTINKNLFEKLWEQAVTEQKEYTVIWNLGFRGQGDRPFWIDDPACVTAEQRGDRISDVINQQYRILRRHVENPLCCINLYGEITALYRAGLLKLPPGVIKVWADNGYGRMVSRRQGNDNPRVHSLPYIEDTGPHGIYYHCSFHDLQASNHLTMSPNSAEFLTAELDAVLNAGAGDYWIVNCGSVKPHVYALDLIREMWQVGKVDVGAWRKRYVETYYGKRNANTIAALFEEYADCTARYGPNADDRAGEQIWHHPVRGLLWQWLSGDTQSGLKRLHWFTGDVPFSEQVKRLEEISGETYLKWDVFYRKCMLLRPLLDADSGQLFDDSIFLHARLQRSGASGTKAFCESIHAYSSGNLDKAFCLADKSRICYMEGVDALAEAEHDKWIGYYDGDCLTDIRLTVSCMDALVSWLRVVGDGPDFHKWERKFLTPAEERKIMLLSSKKRPLNNKELAEGLENTVNFGARKRAVNH